MVHANRRVERSWVSFEISPLPTSKFVIPRSVSEPAFFWPRSRPLLAALLGAPCSLPALSCSESNTRNPELLKPHQRISIRYSTACTAFPIRASNCHCHYSCKFSWLSTGRRQTDEIGSKQPRLRSGAYAAERQGLLRNSEQVGEVTCGPDRRPLDGKCDGPVPYVSQAPQAVRSAGGRR